MTHPLASLLSPSRVRCLVKVENRKRAYQMLSGLLAHDLDALSSQTILEKLNAREKLGSTHLGHGIALPHARLAELEAPEIALITLDTAINFDDKRPVDILCALIVPEQAADEHVEILAKLAKLFHHDPFCAKIRAARSDHELLDVLHSVITQH